MAWRKEKKYFNFFDYREALRMREQTTKTKVERCPGPSTILYHREQDSGKGNVWKNVQETMSDAA